MFSIWIFSIVNSSLLFVFPFSLVLLQYQYSLKTLQVLPVAHIICLVGILSISHEWIYVTPHTFCLETLHLKPVFLILYSKIPHHHPRHLK